MLRVSKHTEDGNNKSTDLTKNNIVDDDSMNPLRNPNTNGKKTFKHAALPKWELMLCFAMMVGFLGYMKYRTGVISKEHLSRMKLSYLSKGWLPFGIGKIDAADFEWLFFKKKILNMSVVYEILIYVIGGRLAEAFFPKFRNHFILVFSIGVLTMRMTTRVISLFAAHTTVAYLASRTGVPFIVWLTGALQILSVVADAAFYRWQESLFPGFALEMIGFTFGVMRFISFGLECCNNPKKYGLFEFLLYNFYYPLWTFGPVMTFDKFQLEINKESRLLSKQELWHIFKQSLRHIFWFFYIEITLHFLYFNAFHRHRAVFRKLPPGDLAVLAGCHMLFFQNKYVLMYGVPGVVALFDRVNVPEPPLCPMGVYSFREMWRHFDRGLHDMLMRYIYIPLGGSRYGLKWASFSSFVAFAAMSVWHGNSARHYAWAFFNWIGIQVELHVMGLAWSPKAVEYQRKLSGPMLRRLSGVVAATNQLLLSLFSMIFIAGPLPIFFIYFNGFFIQGFPWMPVILFFFFYFNVQLDYEVHRRFTFERVYNKKYI
ncbi:protein-cysteine N-palmitoyltransferase HHAT-like [Amphiura filiformis]|uniref:protein-cysteine N-palmitoyltransferase HHAT-like n=1 Tax=Amphiura filiformis TaxID=82378 RepID=UPI003B218645